MSYEKPDGLLLDKPVKRKTAKSAFLRKLEKAQEKLMIGSGKFRMNVTPLLKAKK